MTRIHMIATATCVTMIACSLQASGSGVSTTVYVVTAKDVGKEVGTVRFDDTSYGLLITPDLHSLEPAPHAAHIHERPNCGPSEDGVPGGAAGDHLDPSGSRVHTGPYANGHLGDLPNLIVESDGTSTIPVLAPRAKVADVKERALVIHAGADRYDAHETHQHGKGGDRMYCGVIR